MRKILFFDDEDFITKYLIKSLQEFYGWKGDKQIVFVSTINDVLSEINSEEEYDLFVLDVMATPFLEELKKLFSQNEFDEACFGMSVGFVLAKRIRGMKKYQRVPILFFTASQSPYISEFEKGITAYIRKPASPEKLSRKMNELLDNT